MKSMQGNLNTIFTDENYVYRPKTSYSFLINNFVQHLNRSGFTYSPTFIACNESTDVFSYISGNSIDLNELKDIQQHKQLLKALADILKQFHDIGSSYINTHSSYFLDYTGNDPLETICHNDIAPYNMLWENHQITGLIDFETICPAPRSWDIVYAAYRFIGLGQERCTYLKKLNDKRQKETIRELSHYFGVCCDYPFSEFFLNTLIERLQSLVNLFDREVSKDNEAFIRMKEEGHQEFYRSEIQYIINQQYID